MRNMTLLAMAGLLVSLTTSANTCPVIQGTYDCVNTVSGDKLTHVYKTTVLATGNEYEMYDDQASQAMTFVADGQVHVVTYPEIGPMETLASCDASGVLNVQSKGQIDLGDGSKSSMQLELSMAFGGTPGDAKRPLFVQSGGTWTTTSGMSGNFGPDSFSCTLR